MIRTTLEKQGNIIGSNDLFIAAHVKSLNAILVTNNIKEFERVTDLKVESWVLQCEQKEVDGSVITTTRITDHRQQITE